MPVSNLMKMLVIILGVIISGTIVAGYFLMRDIEWSTIDKVGAPAIPPPGAPSGHYVRCVNDGISFVMEEKECRDAKQRTSGMAL